jgi:hypothetical protein
MGRIQDGILAIQGLDIVCRARYIGKRYSYQLNAYAVFLCPFPYASGRKDSVRLEIFVENQEDTLTVDILSV